MKLKNKKILFIGGPNGRDQWMLKISRELEKRFSTSSYFLGLGKGEDIFYRNEGVNKERIYHLTFDDSNKDLPNPDVNFVKLAEREYEFNSFDIWQITAPRKKKRLKFTQQAVLSWIQLFVKETERIIKEVRPDYFVSQGASSFASVVIYNILRKNGIIQMDIVNARIPNRFTFNDNFEDKWPLLIKEYQNIKKRNLTKEERDFAESFVNSFKEKPFKPDDSARIKVPFSKKVEKYVNYAKTFRYRKQLPDLRQYFWPIKDKFLEISGIFEMPQNDEKYVYYPLHIDPEVSTSLYGKWYVNQLALIENISRSLPSDYKLYVKEHILFYSSRPSYFHKWVKKFPNVRLISPHANSVELNKKSSLVLTITGTAGWEAILLQKPVITFGKIYYNIFEEVTNITEIEKLPALINDRFDKTIDKEKTLKFITAVHKSSFSGIGALPGDCGMRSLEPENIIKIVDAMEDYLARLEK